ncbi:ArpU family transcriptional regulator [Macrococcus brunensis]|uniref:ArpU family transcriptional regulator n=1 Tax=Macrococcus brunensis TaxID=198483 RepID=A0A4V3BDA7_9STAP|nr:ArpU family phage packaging/lysis transcriptional regulator [Macrococcus brunensis]TDL96695.1 ArpU family transcriptional regulator [Macrococcus brunensis]
MTQSLLEIQNLDFKKTRNNVYHTFRKYNKLLRIMPVRSMPSVTQSFSFIPPATTIGLNGIESAASKNLEREKLLLERKELMEQMHAAVDNLKPDEKYIIVHKYLQEEPSSDYSIYTDLGLGKTKYYTVKNDAVIRLAFYLGIEEYSKETTEAVK